MTFKMEKVPSQFGRIAMVTGANSGLGYETALAMSQKGLKVVMACRNLDKAEEAKQKILVVEPKATLEILLLDLSKLASVRNAVKEFRNKHDRLDILINNAGIMYPPYKKTEDNFESQMAVNCFGHFLLTSLLIDLVPNDPASRITWISSSAHKTGRLNLSDINFTKKYSKMSSYGQSKLVCLMYALELDKKLKKAGKKIKSNSAHPGGAHTNLGRNMPKWLLTLMKSTILPFITHPASNGALPILEASLAQDAEGGQYYGPQGFLEMSGVSGVATIAKHAKDMNKSEHLWRISEQLTGASYRLY
ncbi:oxidoreductase [Agaribacter marinus]|uniref:Short-chain dehydrogenase n=1 Tax=Agaribacter marinus TaxID=1431249 RepID=A0AA37T1I1_9ALTE|nr:oxidoreductase [Agaribacter marinus]GLR72219.1 short-chain dehydrogenase [Agaribacter marinus]